MDLTKAQKAAFANLYNGTYELTDELSYYLVKSHNNKRTVLREGKFK
jgi:hypothetical protein